MPLWQQLATGHRPQLCEVDAEARHAGLEVVGLDAYPASLDRSKLFVKEWAAKEAEQPSFESLGYAAVQVKKGRMTDSEEPKFVRPFSFLFPFRWMAS